MNQEKILFIDRDGTLIVEPQDYQVDSLDKLTLLPGVISALLSFIDAGYRLVMVTNQDGLGTTDYPENDFNQVQKVLLNVFSSQGITFDAIRVCRHFEQDKCRCRKPEIGLVLDYLNSQKIDRENSYVIGDRLTDLALADNMGIKGLQLGQGDNKTWQAIANTILNKPRRASIQRKTKETDVCVKVDLDNSTMLEISTGIAFFDHMLSQLASHGGFGLQAVVKGDWEVDDHHTVEDTALTIGQAIAQALGDKRGIGRYGFLLPMDESLAQVAMDLCGRASFVFQGTFSREKVGELSTECVPHFFSSFAQALGAALHIQITGENTHHMIEAIFKGVGRSLRQAIAQNGQILPSTKGVL
ncbi:bifunctional histidinol-phosphatase/imidazoleglycerol-phosphate dehydratase HisB [Candidatus Berkiella aquae]|uniref:Histidine biosynthesis bifunctional protein HisB n=1 Tax=Candidatus Berkiella aquae TaxID=295108 RepID=A0A0Q9YMA7_9GAMM|nr:bifunctional histidinol-phosphatase/imidazoleglycerol-phosphate dehydratase HisB [Candidatus Berkiella aquae]MCS5710407.1 bifunctional histidinol-phosphatase/imidazoleglycerol-phosphate dehydratase HisB [Candidatus Berkiella aquae]